MNNSLESLFTYFNTKAHNYDLSIQIDLFIIKFHYKCLNKFNLKI